MRYKKEILYTTLIISIFGLLMYIETKLFVFKKILPIGENKLIVIILNINLLLILLLLFLVTRTLLKTYIEKKRGIWGSGLKTKLTVTMLLVSAVPSFTLFILATGFFDISMDKWFSQKIEDTIENAQELSRFYYENLFQRYERIANILSREINKQKLLNDEKKLDNYIIKNSKIHFLGYLSVYDPYGNPIKSNIHLKEDLSQKLSESAKKHLSQKGTLREIISLKNGELIIVSSNIRDNWGNILAILLVGDIIQVRSAQRVEEISSVSKEFKESRPFKKILKYGFIIPLFLITILTIFFSVWVGIKMATEITIPIERVKEGAAIIAKGKFDINLEDRGKDEIGTLVSAFNSMAKELKIAKDEIEAKRRYMEVILDNVATGIISTDKTGGVQLMNRAAQTILGIERNTWAESPLTIKEVFGDDFKKHIRSFLKEAKEANWGSITRDMKVNLQNDIKYVRASLTTLRDETSKTEGFIIAFDDITHIVRAEKLATWREIAKKLTHEIKNPLTPIVLSAERIRRRLLSRFQGSEREILDETTSVIIKSVEDIKGIVNELTKLTHTSQTKTIEDINSIVEETISLYKNLYQNITFHFDHTAIPKFRLDRDGIKRAIINLINNSAKAIDNKQGMIIITTKYDKGKGVGILEVADNGAGILDENKQKVFDPYFTKDKHGMGLGLAIVHSIILEHQGKIHVEDNTPEGARFIIELPIVEA